MVFSWKTLLRVQLKTSILLANESTTIPRCNSWTIYTGVKTLSKHCQNTVKTLSKHCHNTVTILSQHCHSAGDEGKKETPIVESGRQGVVYCYYSPATNFISHLGVGSWADTWMSISTNILLFGETLFCQYLHKIQGWCQEISKLKPKQYKLS